MFYFYDLETTGIDARWNRIMQFAGQATDDDLNPVGDPHSFLVRLSDDVLPEPDAVLITGITPQQTLAEGISEAEFLRILERDIAKPGICMAGFNSLRFDDEFLRYTLWRNLHDPYEREWADGRTRWDVVDLVRMTRALRPEGIEWPFDKDGKPTNRLELLTKANHLEHEHAHEALSDVRATIAVAKLVKEKQPKLFEFYLAMRDKKAAAKHLDVTKPQPVVHTSGRFGSDFLSTSVVIPVAQHPVNKNEVIVYDLRYDPTEFAELSVEDLRELAFSPGRALEAAGKRRLPVKTVKLNRSPALAPMGVLDEAAQARIKLTLAQVEAHKAKLAPLTDFRQRLASLWGDEPQRTETDATAMLYQGFVNDDDRRELKKIRALDASALEGYEPNLKDARLRELWLGYKARNFPNTLSPDERQAWDQYRAQKLNRPQGPMSFARFAQRLQQLAANPSLPESKRFLLEELYLYGQSIAPFENESLF